MIIGAPLLDTTQLRLIIISFFCKENEGGIKKTRRNAGL